VEPLIGHPIEVPAALATMLARSAQAEVMGADDGTLKRWLRGLA
jgi:threonine synthase